jgi:hypothetical protein
VFTACRKNGDGFAQKGKTRIFESKPAGLLKDVVMAKNTGRMALYEAIRKSQKSLTPGGKAHQGAKKPKKGFFFRTRSEKLMAQAEARSQWPPREMARPVRRPKRWRVSSKTLFFGVLILAIVVLAGIKFGSDFVGRVPDHQGVPMPDGDEVTDADRNFQAFQSGSLENTDEGEMEGQDDLAGRSDSESEALLEGPGGNNVIVIVTIDTKRQTEILKPVQMHFAAHGIETVIEKRGSFYFLYTKEKFQHPKRQGTDGYNALRKIKEVGLLYKAPTPESNFGIRPFQDAYGMKIR